MDPSSLPQSVLDSPAAAPPPGVIPNMINPPSTGYLLISVESILQGLMMCFVFNRIYAKAFIARKWTWDDMTCFLAFVRERHASFLSQINFNNHVACYNRLLCCYHNFGYAIFCRNPYLGSYSRAAYGYHVSRLLLLLRNSGFSWAGTRQDHFLHPILSNFQTYAKA